MPPADLELVDLKLSDFALLASNMYFTLSLPTAVLLFVL